MALILAQGLGIGLGPAHASAVQASRVLSSARAANAGPGPNALGQPTTPLERVLNPDGTLNTLSGFSGSLDPSGWRLASEPGMPPRFVHDQASMNPGASPSDRGHRFGQSGPGQPMVAGDEKWDNRFALPIGAAGTPYAMAVAGNGDVYMAGDFTTVGGVAANGIARYNGRTWSALGSSSVDGPVLALAIAGNGGVLAGGIFSMIGGVAANNIARWNGSAWSALGSGVGGGDFSNAAAIAIAPNGDVYAGGVFTTAGGVAANNIARWNGSAWSALGSGVGGGDFYFLNTIAIAPSGDVYAGGMFTTAGNVNANNIARWNGSAWSALGTGIAGGDFPYVSSIAISNSGTVYAGGSFTTAGAVSASDIARWNGSTWSALGSGMGGGLFGVYHQVYSVTVTNKGDVYAGGIFTTAGEVTVNNVARWNGSAWSALGSGMALVGHDYGYPFVNTVATASNGDLYAGGGFTTAGGLAVNNVARWNGSAWSAVGVGSGAGMNYRVAALAIAPNGDVYAGGSFTTAGGASANYIARWNGSQWFALGSGVSGGEYTRVGAIAIASNGDVYAGGWFTTAGGVAANNIARWNGSQWSALGSGMDSQDARVGAIAIASNGDVYAGGYFSSAGGVAANNIARWDGSAWSALGSGAAGQVMAVAVAGNGDVYAGGYFSSAGGVAANNIARWDGSAWSAFGAGLGAGAYSFVLTIAIAGNGDAYAGGYFATAGGVAANNIARWDGSAWSALGSGIDTYGQVNTVKIASNGDVYAGGYFSSAGGGNASGIALWNGSQWSALGSGVTNGYDLAQVQACVIAGNGDVYAGGYFSAAGNKPSSYIGRWRPAGQ